MAYFKKLILNMVMVFVLLLSMNLAAARVPFGSPSLVTNQMDASFKTLQMIHVAIIIMFIIHEKSERQCSLGFEAKLCGGEAYIYKCLHVL
ncbi:hypothetical protein PHAVU_005G026900 [Phaseolus vulgaris]|uniref:Transmembrane protein n=1 Tax=Phaseolus vulgaris TaxID=3885 RepID=V7BWI9_PHAVU|nr:hypothetical protein PHAVU_005G026900g [Phaseolus vulgaris]ESW20931.1 hypothetical protein PHAVU_005G026900g [Phaseolus vulgaris]